MAKTYKINSLILCDDIREEKSGKEILIGVYRRVVIVQVLPANLIRLSLRVELATLEDILGALCCKILAPDGSEAGRIDADVSAPLEVNEGISVLNFHFVPLPLLTEGTYRILFGVGHPARQIGDFIVRSGQNTAAPVAPAPSRRKKPSEKQSTKSNGGIQRRRPPPSQKS